MLVCTHVDREHIHSHCIINSVNFETGKKVHMADEQIQELRVRNDQICEELGLPKFQRDEQRKTQGMSNAEYYTASKGESWKFELMRVIDECMRCAGNREEFLRHGKWALGVLKRYFHDTDHNIERWLQGEKCVFIGAATKAPTEIQIGNDLDAFFYFMQFYKMQKEDREPDEDFIDYMALLITRSQSKEWEEC